MNIPAMNIPAAVATKFPSISWSWSKKNSAILKSVKITTSRSAFADLRLACKRREYHDKHPRGELQYYRVCRRGELVCSAQVKQVTNMRGENPHDKGLRFVR